MTAISGACAGLLEMLGAPKDDERVLRLLQSSSHFREHEPFDDQDRGGVWVEISSPHDGIQLQFRDGALDRAVINAHDEAYRSAYPHPTEFIDGLDISTATIDDVRALLGEPWKSSSSYTKHKIGTRYLHTTYRNGRVARFVVMSTPR